MSVMDEHIGIEGRIKEIKESGNYPKHFWRNNDGTIFYRREGDKYQSELSPFSIYTFEELYRDSNFSIFPTVLKIKETVEQIHPLFCRTFEPETWQVKKDTIYAAITAVEDGLEFAKSSLEEHDLNFGRKTKKNKSWAETIEASIRHMELTLEMLKDCPEK